VEGDGGGRGGGGEGGSGGSGRRAAGHRLGFRRCQRAEADEDADAGGHGWLVSGPGVCVVWLAAQSENAGVKKDSSFSFTHITQKSVDSPLSHTQMPPLRLTACLAVLAAFAATDQAAASSKANEQELTQVLATVRVCEKKRETGGPHSVEQSRACGDSRGRRGLPPAPRARLPPLTPRVHKLDYEQDLEDKVDASISDKVGETLDLKTCFVPFSVFSLSCARACACCARSLSHSSHFFHRKR
jgi:hypothetical protein